MAVNLGVDDPYLGAENQLIFSNHASDWSARFVPQKLAPSCAGPVRLKPGNAKASPFADLEVSGVAFLS